VTEWEDDRTYVAGTATPDPAPAGIHPKVHDTRMALAFTLWTALGRDLDAFNEPASQDWPGTWAQMIASVRNLTERWGAAVVKVDAVDLKLREARAELARVRPVVDAARELRTYWRDWPEERRQGVKALSRYVYAAAEQVADAVAALDTPATDTCSCGDPTDLPGVHGVFACRFPPTGEQ
jgi:hypothetical protein